MNLSEAAKLQGPIKTPAGVRLVWRIKERARRFTGSQPVFSGPSHSISRGDGEEKPGGDLLIPSLQNVQGTSLRSDETSLGFP